MNDPHKTVNYEPDGKESPTADPAAAPSHIGRYRLEKVLGKVDGETGQ